MNLKIGSTKLTYNTFLDLEIRLFTLISIMSEKSMENFAPNDPKCSE
jgi:hypothetical protein